MKKVLVLAVLATLVSSSAFAAIYNSKHDMVKVGAVSGTTETCVFCHTPHAANTSVTLAPLWNRDTTTAAGAIYNTNTLNFTSTLTTINATDAPLCLSCHDGSVGASLQNAPNGQTITVVGAYTMATAANIGTDLSNDHPIGFNLGANPESADSGIDTITNITTEIGGSNPFFGASNTMWCSSCHDVHNTVTGTPFLRVANGNSNLCLACHVK